jgi:hypothetical protein
MKNTQKILLCQYFCSVLLLLLFKERKATNSNRFKNSDLNKRGEEGNKAEEYKKGR